jgi:alpha-1,2-mannosyltransferase
VTAGARTRLRATAAILAGILGGALALATVLLPHGLFGVTQYDDGVYFGAAVRLAHGSWPYRDFYLVQPPGITVLLGPLGLLSHLAPTRQLFGAARILTALVTGLDAFGVAWLVRHRGALVALGAGTALALFPPAYFADHTVMLEPYLVGLILLGCNLVFRHGQPASGTRVLLGGMALGAGVATKLWGAVALAVVLLVLVPLRREMRQVATGAAIALGVLVGPFLVAAPRQMYDQVISAQLHRVATAPRQPLVRLWGLMGLHGLSGHLSRRGHLGLLVVITALVGATILLGLLLPLARRRASRLEALVATLALAQFGLIFLPVEYFDHYAYLPAPFVAAALALALSRIWRAISARAGALGVAAQPLALVLLALAASVTLVGALRVHADTVAYDRGLLSVAPLNATKIDALVPPGACVLSDAPAMLLLANRFLARDCPSPLDADGAWLTLDPTEAEGHVGPAATRLIALWRHDLAHARFVVLRAPASFRLPWRGALSAELRRDFVRIGPPDLALYERRA